MKQESYFVCVKAETYFVYVKAQNTVEKEYYFLEYANAESFYIECLNCCDFERATWGSATTGEIIAERQYEKDIIVNGKLVE